MLCAEGPATEAVVLDVRGMKCGGCSAAVKRMLLQQPGVAGAAVNLLTETAVVQVAVPGADSAQAPAELAAAAAAVLTAKGFPAQLRSVEAGVADDAATLSERKEQELRKRWAGRRGRRHRRAGARRGVPLLPRRCHVAGARACPPHCRSTRDLAFAWGLALVCCTHHLGHMLHALGLHQFAHTGGAARGAYSGQEACSSALPPAAASAAAHVFGCRLAPECCNLAGPHNPALPSLQTS